jgi:glycosyltransferase involved in cell wall biosynthesis
MRVLFVIPSYFPAIKYGGPIFSVHNLNKALVRKGIDVSVYTTDAGLQGRVPINVEIPLDSVKIIYFSYTNFFDFLGATGWHLSLPMTMALRREVVSFDIIYILALWNYPVAATAYLCRKFGKPYVISPRGLLYPNTFSSKVWKKLPYYVLIAKKDLKSAAAIHYTSEDEAEKCHRAFNLPSMPIVIPNGIELSEHYGLRSKNGLKKHYPHIDGKKVIIFLGRISWKKGLDILIKAYGLLLQQRKDVHLLIVGTDDEGYGSKIKRLITNEGLEYLDLDYNNKNLAKPLYSSKSIQEFKSVQVTFTGMLEGKQKLEVLSCSDVFVLPSYSENFGMAVIEAMACGVPVVISNNVGIYRDVEGYRAGIVAENDPKSLCEGIRILLDNETLREEIARNGNRLVRDRYDINKVAEMMIKAYEEILTNDK